MHWFTRPDSALRLGDDPVRLYDAWTDRRHWKKMDPEILGEILIRSQEGVFDQPNESCQVVRNLIFLAEEQKLLQTTLLKIAKSPKWSTSEKLERFARVFGSVGSVFMMRAERAFRADEAASFAVRAEIAFTAAIACETMFLPVYVSMALLCVNVHHSAQGAAEWCKRFRRAEAALTRIPDPDLSLFRREQKDALDPAKAEEMRLEIVKYAPHLLPGMEDSGSAPPIGEMIAKIEKHLSSA